MRSYFKVMAVEKDKLSIQALLEERCDHWFDMAVEGKEKIVF